MTVEVSKHFEKDVLKIRDKKSAAQLQVVIAKIERCTSLEQITQLRKMNHDGEYYRIRLGDYRLGLQLIGDRVKLLRFMHRKEIYRFFP